MLSWLLSPLHVLTFGDQRGLRTPPADFAQEVRRSGIEEAHPGVICSQVQAVTPRASDTLNSGAVLSECGFELQGTRELTVN